MRRHRSVAAAAVATALGLSVATLASAEPDGSTARGHRPPEVIRLVERVHDVAFDDRGEPGATLGDRLVFTADIFDEHDQRVGRDGADCVIVRIDPAAPPSEQQVVECMVSLELPDGQLTFQGLAQGLDNTFALTGGTGAYRTARGEAVVHDRIFLHEAEITLVLFQ